MALKIVKMEAYSLKEFENITIKGYYIGTKEIDTDLGVSEVHEFYNAEKKSYFSFWGVTALNNKLKQVPEGAYVEFTYRGKSNVKTKYGTKPVHQCDVSFDPEDTMFSQNVDAVINPPKKDVVETTKQTPVNSPVQPKAKILDDDLPF
jgi:hypothetical protein